MQSNLKQIVDRAKYSSNSFAPTDAHRRAKSAFWAHFFQTGELPPEAIEAATAARYSGYNDVVEWYNLPGFREWFSNGEEFRQRIEYLSNSALDVLHEVLTNQAARTGDKLAAAKMAFEIASKFPKSAPKEQFADEKIAEMDKKQLEEFISSKVKSLDISKKSIDTPVEVSDTIPVSE